MGDYEDDYGDDFYFEDDGYLYIEDSYAVADELAEHAIPSPVIPDALDDSYFGDYDHYEYFMDIEYGTDEYYDLTGAPPGAVQPVANGSKRKRIPTKDDTVASKRRKTVPQVHTEQGNIPATGRVLWKPAVEVFQLDQRCAAKTIGDKPFALIPDWRERFKDQHGFVGLGKDYKTEFPPAVDAREDEEDDDMEEEEEAEDDDVEVNIDPDMLKAALEAKLASSGLSGADQGTFLASLMEMISGGEGPNMDDMLGTLTKGLLAQASEGGSNSAVTQWLSQQGVSLVDADEDEEIDDTLDKSNGHSAKITESSPGVSTANGLPAATVAPAAIENLDDDLPHSVTSKHEEVDIPAKSRGKAREPAEEAAGKKGAKKVSFAEDEKTSTTDQSAATVDKPVGAQSEMATRPARQAEARKRKTPPADSAPGPEQPKRRLRNFAAPTASSESKVERPKKPAKKTK